MNKYLDNPIPVIADPGNCERRAFIDSPLVDIEPNDKLLIEMQYPILGFENAEKRCMARKEVVEMLYRAAENLPSGYKFVIWDAWRPFALQKELFISYSSKIIKEFHLENLTSEEQEHEIAKFIADPIPNEELPPAHTTGGAIDLTIMRPDGKYLDFGTDFDAFTEKTRAAYYETIDVECDSKSKEIRDNRRFLYNLMIEAGFGNLPSEWWHYEYGDKNWADIQGKSALYKGIFKY
ncbi:MAG: M15 family metallopeptidase [[Eubacterium] sulci]|jgi:peptidase M15D, vanX D-ala-D-ala dipeptidase|nr:M15 family metallopeptidase [[Eubacterium] sulci]